jgi:hypothetical protein
MNEGSFGDLGGVPLPSQRKGLIRGEPKKRPPRKIEPELLDLDSGLADRPNVSLSSVATDFERSVVRVLDMALGCLRQDFLNDFRTMVADVFSFDSRLSMFIRRLNSDVKKVLEMQTMDTGEISDGSLNEVIESLFSTLTVPQKTSSAPIDPEEEHWDRSWIRSLGRDFSEKCSEILDQIVMERSQLGTSRSFLDHSAVIAHQRKTQVAQDLEAKKVHQDIAARSLISMTQRLEFEQECLKRIREADLREIEAFDSGIITGLGDDIRQASGRPNSKKISRFAEFSRDFTMEIMNICQLLCIRYGELAELKNSIDIGVTEEISSYSTAGGKDGSQRVRIEDMSLLDELRRRLSMLRDQRIEAQKQIAEILP